MAHVSGGKIIATVAGILCAASLFSSLRAEDSGIKSLTFSLGVLSAGIGCGSFGASIVDEDYLTGILNRETSRHEREIAAEKNRAKTLEQKLNNERVFLSGIQKEKEAREKELQEQYQKEQQYRVREAQCAVLVKNLNDALAKRDTRYEEITAALQSGFWSITRKRIDTDYERMGNVINSRIDEDDFVNIRDKLQRFYDSLYVSHAKHCEVLDEIEALDSTSADFAQQVTTFDDKDDAKNIMTALRHTNQRQILVGQCAEVGANRWTWGDMTNCALVALGDSIGIVAKHLVKDMGWTLAKANKLKKEYETFAAWALKHNESEDIPNENRYRIALLIVGSRYSFLEMPCANKGIIRSDKALIRDSLSKNTQNTVFSTNENTLFFEQEMVSTASQLTCPHCGSHSAHKHSAVKDESKYRYICLKSECKKTFIAARFF
jgi:hypothetical protein